MRTLPIDEFHRRFGKELTVVAGCTVPAYYSSVAVEISAAATGPVLIDRSFAGVVHVAGKDAESLLHRLTTNEMRNLRPGQGVVNIFTNAKGRIVDVVEMLRRAEDYLLITSPGRAAALQQWIDKYTFVEDVRGKDVGGEYAIFSICGKIGSGFADLPLEGLALHGFRESRIAGVQVILHHGGEIMPEGYNILVAVDGALAVWNSLREQAEPIGFAAYDALRIHAGIPAADAEITDQHNPHEAGLRSFINYEKGCYIGQEVIARLDTYDKVQRQLVGLEFEEGELPRAKSSLWVGEEEAGVLTSVAPLPGRKKNIGLGVLRKSFAETNRRLAARQGEQVWTCTVVNLPIY
jgi:hypothetical protein